MRALFEVSQSAFLSCAATISNPSFLPPTTTTMATLLSWGSCLRLPWIERILGDDSSPKAYILANN